MDQLNEQGAGDLHGDVLPARPKSSTSAEKKELYDKLRVKVMELLKKVAGVDSVFDNGEEAPSDELEVMKRNAGVPTLTMIASEDNDIGE